MVMHMVKYIKSILLTNFDIRSIAANPVVVSNEVLQLVQRKTASSNAIMEKKLVN